MKLKIMMIFSLRSFLGWLTSHNVGSNKIKTISLTTLICFLVPPFFLCEFLRVIQLPCLFLLILIFKHYNKELRFTYIRGGEGWKELLSLNLLINFLFWWIFFCTKIFYTNWMFLSVNWIKEKLFKCKIV